MDEGREKTVDMARKVLVQIDGVVEFVAVTMHMRPALQVTLRDGNRLMMVGLDPEDSKLLARELASWFKEIT